MFISFKLCIIYSALLHDTAAVSWLHQCQYFAPKEIKIFNPQKLKHFNPLNAELNPICHLLALLGAHHILHVSTLWVKGHFKPLNAKLNPICHLLALLGAHHILHVSRIKVKCRKGAPPITSRIKLFNYYAVPKQATGTNDYKQLLNAEPQNYTISEKY